MKLPTIHLVAILACLVPGAATAATIHVDTTTDDDTTNGDCSLREAIQAANSNAAIDGCAAGEDAEDEIILGPGTYQFTASDESDTGMAFEVLGVLTIRGAGADATIIDAAQLDRHFDVLEGATLHLEDLTLVNGEAPAGVQEEEIGAAGGAIRARGTVHIERCVLSSNRAGTGGPGGPGGDGGAIQSTARITIADSVLVGNASGNGGSVLAGGEFGGPATLPGIGGAIATTGNLTIDRSRIELNHLGSARFGGGTALLTSGRGAAISAAGTLLIRDSSISGNGKAGHLSERGVVWAGETYTIARTSFMSNLAHTGSAVYGAHSGTITNAVVIGNDGGADGRALHAATGLMELHSSTVTGNVGGGLARSGGGNVMFRNSIIRGNTGSGGALDCGGNIDGLSSRGYNLLAAATDCPTNSNDHVTDEPALLEAMTSDHFIPTYIPLLESSVAVDGGSCGPILPTFGFPRVSNDILRKSRPAEDPCSIGAFQHVGEALRFQIEEAPPGPNCPDGGSRIAIGTDTNFDGVLDDLELSSFAFVCHGSEGPSGESCTVEADGDGNAIVTCPDGTSVVVPAGSPALIRLVAEPAGANCAAGGQRVEAGRDLDGNGVLDPAEVESAAFICAASDGIDGTDGADGTDGDKGADGAGASCTVEKTKGGGARVVCPDGSTATVDAPKDADGGCTTAGGGLSALGFVALAFSWLRRRSGSSSVSG